MMRRLIALGTLCVCACAATGATGGFVDDFGGPSDAWQITSGSLSFEDGVARTDSPVFRMVSADRGFNDVTVTVTLAVDDLRKGPDWSGAHVWVRYQSQYELYAVSVDREDGAMIIKKKCAGGSDNGGTYYDLTAYQPDAPVPFGEWQNVTVSATDQPDGSVAITASRDGHSMSANDTGIGCAPLHGGGVGVRGDNAVIRLDRIVVQSV
ncbi:MAG: hypothetical protein QOI01_205 [Mycobacterium sp.]|jgi:hypothetical protein|nr:hypothetical protein [Mycobacterium sp.]